MPQNPSHAMYLQASYRMSVVIILGTFDRAATAMHCIDCQNIYVIPATQTYVINGSGNGLAQGRRKGIT